MGDNVDIKELLRTYAKHWKWFLLSVVLTVAVALVKLRYTKSTYRATAKIQIIEENNGGLDLLSELDVFSLGKNNVLDEIEIIKSRSHLIEVVKRLGINIRIMDVGNVLESEIYTNPPININFVAEDSIINKTEFEFNISLLSDTTFSYSDENTEERTYTYGSNLSTILGDVVITPNLKVFDRYRGNRLHVLVTPVNVVADYLKEVIEIVNEDELSNIVNIYYENEKPIKARDVVSELISIYNENAIKDKQTIANRTSAFIDNRITDISLSLTDVDESAETLRTSKGIVDIASEANINLTAGASNRQELASAQNQLNIASSMLDMVEQQNDFEVLPANLGLSDPTIASTTAKYNQLVQERNRLLKSSNEKNPVIVNLDEQLNSLKKTMSASLNSSVSNLNLTVNTLSGQQSIINSRIYAAPKNERALRDITRKQQTTEALYLYLLQKREEAQIAAVSTAPKSKIVDFPATGRKPVAPKRAMILLAAGIFGMLIPFSIIYVRDILDNKISNMKGLEGAVKDTPIIGEIPKLTKKQLKNIVVNDRTVLGESLRIIRTNLDYLIKTKKNEESKSNVVFVSSSVSGEGKTFVSSNLAMILAATNKKVLLVGADIRNPKLTDFFDPREVSSSGKHFKDKIKKRPLGITEYLIDSSVLPADVINTIEFKNNSIDVVYSGRIPPNPAELLLSEKMGKLFRTVSDRYDYVIVDTAPLMLVTDTLLISQFADHFIYVTRAGVTENRAVEYPLKLKEEEKLNGLCFLVNDVADSDLGYGGMHSYGYGKTVKKWWNFG